MEIVALDVKKELIMETNEVVVEDVTVDVAEPEVEDVKTFTQAELDSKFKERATRAKADLLKELGIEDVEATKAELAKFKEYQEAQKSEADKQAELVKAQEAETARLTAENNQLSTKLTMVTKGVKADSLDDVAVLAGRLVGDEVTIEQAIDQVLEKYPNFSQVATESDTPAFVKPGNMTGGSNDLDPFAAKMAKYK